MNTLLRKIPFASRAACAILASFVVSGLAAQGAEKRPQLVIGIFVDGLSHDYVELLRENFSKNGFNRFLSEGVVIDDIDFGTTVDRVAATGMLVTGAAPAVNGIPAAYVWDEATRADYPVLLDPASIGNYTEGALTPAPLLVSTISDEVRISEGGVGVVHSIATDPQTAILLAGHAGNSGFWLSDATGKWQTSRSYKEMPAPATKRNYGLSTASRLDTLAWTPSMALDRYPDVPDYKKLYPFRHTFPARDPKRFKAYLASAPANREIADIATEYISALKLGTRGVTDMLNIGVSVAPYLYGRDADNRIETLDAYLRLDSDIARIIDAVEKGPGTANTLFFIAGTPAPTSGRRDDNRWGIPGGRFSPRKASSLLNMYLMALHGQGDYVSGFHRGYFHLNSRLLKERGIDPSEMRREAAEFLTRMSGVSEAFTIDDIIARRAGESPAALQRNTYAPLAGDVLVSVNPGWEITDAEDDEAADTDDRLSVVRQGGSHATPVYILAPNLPAQKVHTPVDARAIAPTICRTIRIRAPNGAATAPLRFEKSK